jgi:hypothetical protein
MSDHERIYLEPSPGADEDYGRQWCQHNVWDESTEYVRADLHEATAEERDRLREAIIEACDLLMERKQGSPARSPSHNARLRLEEAIGNWNGRPLSPPTAEGRES